jgi:hypothetical protein
MAGQFCLQFRLPRKSQGSFTCRKSATWDKRLYFPSERRHAVDFFAGFSRVRTHDLGYQRPACCNVYNSFGCITRTWSTSLELRSIYGSMWQSVPYIIFDGTCDTAYILSVLGLTCVWRIQSALQRFSEGTDVMLLQVKKHSCLISITHWYLYSFMHFQQQSLAKCRA